MDPGATLPVSQKEGALLPLSLSFSSFSSGHFNLCPWILNSLYYCYCSSAVTHFFPLALALSALCIVAFYSKVDVTQPGFCPSVTPRETWATLLFSTFISALLLLSHLSCDKPCFIFATPRCDPCCFRDIPTPLSLRHANTTSRLRHRLVPYMHLDKTFGISVTRDRHQFISNHHSNQSRPSCSAHQIGKKAPFYI